MVWETLLGCFVSSSFLSLSSSEVERLLAAAAASCSCCFFFSLAIWLSALAISRSTCETFLLSL